MRVIVIGTSAGGVQALKTLLGDLPFDLDAILLAVIHLAPSSPGFLPDLFASLDDFAVSIHPKAKDCNEGGSIWLRRIGTCL